MFNQDKGRLVVILQDCRDGKNAKGMYGIHEGDWPIAWSYVGRDGSGEIEYTPENEQILRKYGMIPCDEMNDRTAAILFERHGIKLPFAKGSDINKQMSAFNLLEEYRAEILSEVPGEYFPHTNPRIRLEDGSTIWGYECWWKPMDARVSAEEMEQVLADGEKGIELHCNLIRKLIQMELSGAGE